MRFSRSLLTVVVGMSVPSAAYAGQETVYRIGQGITAPRLEREVKPEYTPAAMAARVEGIVKLECVVRADGTVGEAQVTTPLHPDLDYEALRALAEWRFKPGTKDGQPVAVRVEVEMSFALRNAAQVPRGPALGSPDVYKTGNGVTAPAILREVKPSYTREAMSAGVQGQVYLDCVVLPDGTVGDIRVTHQLHPGLDNEARRALRRWTFKPATKDGVAVPVQVQVEMTFTLRSGPPKLLQER